MADDCDHVVVKAREAEFELQKATAYFRKGRFADAIICLARADALDPENGEILAWMAWCHYRHSGGSAGLLRDRLREASAASPRSSLPRMFLAETHFDAGELEQAIGCYRRVLELDPEHQKAQHQLDLCLHLLGKMEKR